MPFLRASTSSKNLFYILFKIKEMCFYLPEFKDNLPLKNVSLADLQ